MNYQKRVAFLISDQHLIPHGGIGSFAKSFTEMGNRLGWKVDILLDKKPTNDFSKIVEQTGAKLIWPADPLSYSDHTATYAFTDTVNFEKIINFRKSLLKAFETNLYDLIVCNTQESMSAAYTLSVSEYLPVVFYTHLHSMIFREDRNFKDVFLPSFHNFYNKHIEFPDVIVGTQSEKNVESLKSFGSNAKVLGLPISDRELLEDSSDREKSGVLFIGRWEDGKNPHAFVRVIKETGLPAKVMTSSSSKKKFEQAFIENGIKDYDIRSGISGLEKVDFIKSAKIHFNPSLRESYSFAFLECLGHMPCVVLKNQDWSDNFKEFYWRVDLDHAAELITELYSLPKEDDAERQSSANLYINDLDQIASNSWNQLIASFVSKKSNNSNAKINGYDTIRYGQFIEDLNRNHLAREDFESVLSNRHKFNVVYTDNDTWLSKDPDFIPTENNENSGLFSGL